MVLDVLKLIFLKFTRLELKQAAYALWRAKSYSLTMILTLGFTLGALLTALQLNYQILAAPLPYPQPQQLYLVRGQTYTGDKQNYANLMTLAGAVKLYQQATLWSATDEAQAAAPAQIQQAALVAFGNEVIRSHEDGPQVRVGYISPEYFRLLEVPFGAGQALQASDGLEQHSAVVVISDRLWQRLYQRSPNAIGQSLQLGTVSFRIIGVTAANFVEPALLGPGQYTDLWLPWDFNPTYQELKNWWGALAPDHHLLLRLKDGTDAAKLAQRLSLPLNQAYRDAVDASPYAAHFVQSRIAVSLQPLAQVIQADSATTSLLALTGCVLLLGIALVNLSQLWLARHFSQQQQYAVRVALGAQPAQLTAMAFRELLWLISIASVLALLLCAALLPLIRLLAAPYLARMQELNLQPQLWLLLLIMLLGLGYAGCRAFQPKFSLSQLQQQLQRSGKGGTGQQQRSVAFWLLASQAAVTTLLLGCSAQLGLKAWQQLLQPPGFSTVNIQHLVLNRVGRQAPTTDELLQLRDHLATKPGIAMAALASSMMLDFNQQSVQDSLSWPADTEDQQSALRLESSYTDHQLLPLLQAKLLSGRFFNERDLREQQHGVVINATAAAKLLQQVGQPAKHQTLIGQRLLLNGDTPVEVVGVVADFSLSLNPEQPRLWLPNFYHFLPDLLLHYQSAQPFNTVQRYDTAQLNHWLAEVNPVYRVQRSDWLEDKRRHSQFLSRLTLALTLALSFTGLLLAAIGSYGVLSYQLQLRHYELAVRQALGARPQQLRWQLLRDYLPPLAAGCAVAAGLLGLFVQWQWLSGTGLIMDMALSCLMVLMLTLLVLLHRSRQLLQRPIQRQLVS
jgi:predicted permease